MVVRKFEGQRAGGASDTVRRTEVEIEDTRDDEDVRAENALPGADSGSRGRTTRPERPTRQ